MCLRAFTFSFLMLWTCSSYCADESEVPADVEDRYQKILTDEEAPKQREAVVENVAAGGAALCIGLYGYYNDNRGLMTRLIYSATQTAGVLMVSDAILSANNPSFMAMTDAYLARGKTLDIDKFKFAVVNLTRKQKLAQYKQLAYSGGILSGIYFYNAYRESEPSLRNVFYFLGANFFLVSAANFYRLLTFQVHIPVSQKAEIKTSFDLAPFPTFTANF